MVPMSVKVDRLKIVPGSPDWPPELLELPDAPEALWLRGATELLGSRPRVAIVGSRAATPYALDQAGRFSAALARRGLSIVSGLARGVDAAAHRAALDEDGTTIAILGSGVDCPWPGGALTESVAERGLLVSEFALGRGPRRHHFPLRNRLISALASAVLVVEAARHSGSLITARWALDQGREVFVIPGRIDHPMARGVLSLLRQGATPIESPEQLLEDMGWARRADPPQGPDWSSSPGLLAHLVGETLTANELAGRAGRPVEEVLSALATLELEGLVARAPGGLYRTRSRGPRSRSPR